MARVLRWSSSVDITPGCSWLSLRLDSVYGRDSRTACYCWVLGEHDVPRRHPRLQVGVTIAVAKVALPRLIRHTVTTTFNFISQVSLELLSPSRGILRKSHCNYICYIAILQRVYGTMLDILRNA